MLTNDFIGLITQQLLGGSVPLHDGSIQHGDDHGILQHLHNVLLLTHSLLKPGYALVEFLLLCILAVRYFFIVKTGHSFILPGRSHDAPYFAIVLMLP